MPDEVVTDAVTEAPEVEGEVESFETTDDAEVEGAEVQSADGQTYTVRVDGQDVEVTLDELRNGYSRQADYTRKTQELASEREQIAALRRLEESLNSDPAGTIAALRQVFGLDAQETEDDDLDPVERQVRELSQWRAQQEADARERRYIEEATASAAKYGLTDVSPQDVLQFAVENKIGVLDVAARLMKADADVKAAESAKAKTTEAKRTAAVVEGGRTRVPQATKPARFKDIREAYAAAKAQHTGA